MLIYALEITVEVATTRDGHGRTKFGFCFYTELKDLENINSDLYLFGYCEEPYREDGWLTKEAHNCFDVTLEKFKSETKWPFVWLHFGSHLARVCYYPGSIGKLEIFDHNVQRWKNRDAM